MTLAIFSYVSDHAAVPLVAMLIKLVYNAVLMANIPIAFIIAIIYFIFGQIDIKDNKFTHQLYRSMQHEHIWHIC